MSLLPHFALGLVHKYFRKKFPYRPQYSYTEREWETFRKQYNNWEGKKVFTQLGIILLVPIGLENIFFIIYVLYYSRTIKPPELFFPVGSFTFWIPGMLLTLCFAGLLSEMVLRKLVKTDYEVFEDRHNSLRQYDTRKAGILSGKILFPFFVLVFFLVFTSRYIATADRLTFREFYELSPRTYLYKDMKVIFFSSRVTPQGDEYPSPHYKIASRDQTNEESVFNFEDTAALKQLVKLINKSVDSVRIDHG